MARLTAWFCLGLGCAQEEELKKAVLLVFANKQDLPGACTETEVSKLLGLSALKNRTWTIFKTSAKKGEGLTEAMDWYAHACYLRCFCRVCRQKQGRLDASLQRARPAAAVCVSYGPCPSFVHPHGCVLSLGW